MPTRTRKTAVDLDLDAARREITNPDGFTVRFGGNTLRLPAELPLEVFEPLLDPQLDVLGAVGQIIAASGKTDTSVIVGVLLNRPGLPAGVLDAVKEGLRRLLGDEQQKLFVDARPSLQDYQRFISGVLQLYGVSLGEALAPPEGSEGDGGSSKETSGGTTGSTSDVSG